MTPSSVRSVRRLFMFTSYSPDQWNVLPGRSLEAGEVDAMPAVEREVFLGKIFAHTAHELNGGIEAGRHGGVAGGAAQQARVYLGGGFDGIQGGGTNN
jgi:hypothetical protein